MGFNSAFEGLKSYSNMKDINSIKRWVLWSRRGGVWCQTGDIPVCQGWFLSVAAFCWYLWTECVYL